MCLMLFRQNRTFHTWQIHAAARHFVIWPVGLFSGGDVKQPYSPQHTAIRVCVFVYLSVASSASLRGGMCVCVERVVVVCACDVSWMDTVEYAYVCQITCWSFKETTHVDCFAPKSLATDSDQGTRWENT